MHQSIIVFAESQAKRVFFADMGSHGNGRGLDLLATHGCRSQQELQSLSLALRSYR
jgi:hypothetical protein